MSSARGAQRAGGEDAARHRVEQLGGCQRLPALVDAAGHQHPSRRQEGGAVALPRRGQLEPERREAHGHRIEDLDVGDQPGRAGAANHIGRCAALVAGEGEGVAGAGDDQGALRAEQGVGAADQPAAVERRAARLRAAAAHQDRAIPQRDRRGVGEAGWDQRQHRRPRAVPKRLHRGKADRAPDDRRAAVAHSRPERSGARRVQGLGRGEPGAGRRVGLRSSPSLPGRRRRPPGAPESPSVKATAPRRWAEGAPVAAKRPTSPR